MWIQKGDRQSNVAYDGVQLQKIIAAGGGQLTTKVHQQNRQRLRLSDAELKDVVLFENAEDRIERRQPVNIPEDHKGIVGDVDTIHVEVSQMKCWL